MKNLIAELIKERFVARNFCTSFEVESYDVDVHVEGIGAIKLPVQPKIARQLIEYSTPSKFGFKEETLYDPSIRKSYEIGAEKIQLGAVFEKQLATSLARIKKELLFPATSKLSAELHNMLIYEKGCFFELHQDSEKEDGMMASLVVVLPSTYRGGELVIEYQKQRKELPEHRHYGSYVKNDTLTFIAFYADCLHSIKKLTYGYRVALSFNLILEDPQELKDNTEHAKTAHALKEYFATQEDLPSYRRDEPKWFVYLLNHQYTPKSVSWQCLKGVDKEAAAVFKQVAKKLELDVHLALADIQETWDVVDDYYYDGHRARGRQHDIKDNIDELELEGLMNKETVLSNWLDEDGKTSDFASHYVHDSMVFSSCENSKYTPESSEYEGYMGNYGNTLDRWYKRTAIVLWPKKGSLESKFAIDANMGIKELIKISKANIDAGIAAYDAIKETLKKPHMIAKINVEHLAELSIALNKQEYLKEIFASCSIDKISSLKLNKISELLEHFGDKIVSQTLLLVKKETDGAKKRIKAYYDIIASIYKNYPLTAKTLLSLWLEEFWLNLPLESWQVGNVEYRDEYIKDTQKNLVFLVKVLDKLGEEFRLEKIFEALYKNKEILGGTFLYEIFHHQKLNQHFDVLPKYKLFKKEALQTIELILNNPLDDSNWTIDELPRCSCELCLQLKEFLFSSSSYEKSWPIGKERRQHIHNVIEQLALPVSHETLRQGSPHRLILQKNSKLLSWRGARYNRLRKLMKAAAPSAE